MAVVALVPNFSEGRRADVMDAIVDALRVPGARLLYRQGDVDHNRLDTTLAAGSVDPLIASALAGVRVAAEHIDMDRHKGGHPRMGAADVIPFVPIRGIGMDECVEAARETARRIGEELGVPVYLYGEAALVPERRSLAEVRRGQFEGLRRAVERGERLPDLGPHRIGRAGATAVGARKPLVAFNVYLTGEEPQAKEIASELRESGGGLPTLRAIGFAIPDRGCVTVSMNLTDHEVVATQSAFDAVREAAAARGLEVLDSEIVGLVPAASLPEDPETSILLRGFDPATQIFENAMEEETS